jgi:hypothetical protein
MTHRIICNTLRQTCQQGVKRKSTTLGAGLRPIDSGGSESSLSPAHFGSGRQTHAPHQHRKSRILAEIVISRVNPEPGQERPPAVISLQQFESPVSVPRSGPGSPSQAIEAATSKSTR